MTGPSERNKQRQTSTPGAPAVCQEVAEPVSIRVQVQLHGEDGSKEDVERLLSAVAVATAAAALRILPIHEPANFESDKLLRDPPGLTSNCPPLLLLCLS